MDLIISIILGVAITFSETLIINSILRGLVEGEFETHSNASTSNKIALLIDTVFSVFLNPLFLLILNIVLLIEDQTRCLGVVNMVCWVILIECNKRRKLLQTEKRKR